MTKEKRNIKELIEKEAPNLNNILEPEDVSIFKEMTEELRDTWTKKQMFRTETEMQFSVLNDAKYPTKAAKYWQCVREQNVFLENLMSLSFDYRRAEVRIKKLQEKLGDDKVGEMFCLGHCCENNAFHYDGENYAGNDINKIDQIIKGEDIKQEKFFSKSFASTSFLMDNKLSNLNQFKDLLNKFINTDKQEIIK